MTAPDLLAGLPPLQEDTVRSVYFERRSLAETAVVLGVERDIAAAALSDAFRHFARVRRERPARP